MKRLALAVVLGSALWPSGASAVDFPAGCAGTSGDTSALIAAIEQANLTPTPDTVVLSPGCSYDFISSHNGWFGLNALPPIRSDITIEGNGATLARSDAASLAFRFFFVGAPASDTFATPGSGRLTLRNLTLIGGFALGGGSNNGGGGAGMGGAIFNMGALIVERTLFLANGAQGGGTGMALLGNGGGGMAGPGGTGGGGMGDLGGGDFGSGGGAGGNGGGGGGAGLRSGQPGVNGTPTGGPGGGSHSGTGGIGGGIAGGVAGEGSGGGGLIAGVGTGGAGGAFGKGGAGGNGGGGGGAGGGGGSGTSGNGGGGGFGGGGGAAPNEGGSGGFGGGAGRGTVGALPDHGAPGFGGGAASSTKGGGGAGMGGAIFNFYGSVSVSNSTFTNNSADGGGTLDAPEMGAGMGGAVFNMNGPFTAVNSTFANNHSSAKGTSIYNLSYDDIADRVAQLTLTNTIVGRATAGPADVVSSEADYNVDPGGGSADANVGDRNLVERAIGEEGGSVTGTALTADPLLTALADNGGPTRTMAPATGSAALDAGREAGFVVDQRGFPRPSDLPGVANFAGGTDIGAVEVQAPAPPGGGNPGGGNGGGNSQAFGADMLVTMRVARSIGRRGVVPVVVSNGNAFAVTGRLSGRSARRLKVGASQRRFVRLRAKALSLSARGTRVVNLRLPKTLRRTLLRRRRVALRLTLSVRDPAGNVRAISRRAAPRLRR